MQLWLYLTSKLSLELCVNLLCLKKKKKKTERTSVLWVQIMLKLYNIFNIVPFVCNITFRQEITNQNIIFLLKKKKKKSNQNA